MLTLIRILVIVYYLSVNVYSFILLRSQKCSEEEGDCKSVRDGNILISAILGGALGVYVGMFILKYRLKSLIFMVFMPVLTVLNIYLITIGFMNNFWVITENIDLINLPLHLR